jgi:hypothetical protein
MTAVRTGFVALDVDDPLVAWLVYRGEIVSSHSFHEGALSFWLTRYLKQTSSANVRSKLFKAELALEQLRSVSFPQAVSRLTGFYLFEQEDAARAAMARDDPARADTIVEVELRSGAKTSRHDAEWITRQLGEPGTDDWMHAYLSGVPVGPAPIWEFLVDGRALIYGTRVREAAYDTVVATWSDSLPLLEMARLGVELGSDLGLITAMLVRREMRTRTEYVIDMRDADDEGFLARLRKFDGPVNGADLAHGPGRVPDLRNRGFVLL